MWYFVFKSSRFKVGQLIALNLDPHTLTDIVEIDDSVISLEQKVLGRVVRVEEVHPDRRYDLGVCFIRAEADTDEEVKNVIQLLQGKTS